MSETRWQCYWSSERAQIATWAILVGGLALALLASPFVAVWCGVVSVRDFWRDMVLPDVRREWREYWRLRYEQTRIFHKDGPHA